MKMNPGEVALFAQSCARLQGCKIYVSLQMISYDIISDKEAKLSRLWDGGGLRIANG